MNPFIKTYTKIGILILGITLFFTNCQKDDVFIDEIVTVKKENSISAKRITLKDIEKNNELKLSLSNIEKQFDYYKKNDFQSKSSTYSKVASTDNSFTILTDEILEVTTNTTTAYTFRIETPTDPKSAFENFVVQKKNDEDYQLYIYRYKKIKIIEGLDFKYSMSRELVDNSQVDLGGLGLKMMYDPGSDCHIDVSTIGDTLVITILYCGDNGTGGDGGISGDVGGISTGDQIRWESNGDGTCNKYIDTTGPLGYPITQVERNVSCPDSNDYDTGDGSSDPWPWDESGDTSGGDDTLHDGDTGGGTRTTGDDTTTGSEPKNPPVGVLLTQLDIAINNFFNCLTDEQNDFINYFENRDIKTQIEDFLEASYIPPRHGSDLPPLSPETLNFAKEAVDAKRLSGEVDFEELYIRVDTPDDDYIYLGTKQLIPNPLILSSGDEISITFSTTKDDNVNSNQQVATDLVDAMRFVLEEANSNLALAEQIISIHISATTNGHDKYPTSNHLKASAVDISRINGVKMINSGLTNQIMELQKAFDNFTYIRENFGPYFKHKYVRNTNTWNYNHPVSGHKDHIHIAVRR